MFRLGPTHHPQGHAHQDPLDWEFLIDGLAGVCLVWQGQLSFECGAVLPVAISIK